jgi:hypothetical protein
MLRHSPQYNGLLINVCTGEIVMDNKIESATTTHHSACNTCHTIPCEGESHIGGCVYCQDEVKKGEPEENFEYHLVDVELSKEFDAQMKAYSVLDTRNSFDKCLDKISDGVIYVSVLFMQTFDKICDRFLKAFKEKRL